MLVVVFHDVPYRNLSVGQVIGLPLVVSESFSRGRQGQEDHRCPVQPLVDIDSEGKVDSVSLVHDVD